MRPVPSKKVSIIGRSASLNAVTLPLASASDCMGAEDSTRLGDRTDHIILPRMHMVLTNSSLVIDHLLAFLVEGPKKTEDPCCRYEFPHLAAWARTDHLVALIRPIPSLPFCETKMFKPLAVLLFLLGIGTTPALAQTAAHCAPYQEQTVAMDLQVATQMAASAAAAVGDTAPYATWFGT